MQNVCQKENNKTKFLFHIGTFLSFERAQVLTEAYIS